MTDGDEQPEGDRKEGELTVYQSAVPVYCLRCFLLNTELHV